MYIHTQVINAKKDIEFSPGKETGPPADLVSQMMEEALEQSDVSKEHYEEYVYESID